MEQQEQQSGNASWASEQHIARGFDATVASVEGLERRIRPYIDTHPFVALGLVAVGGFLIGRLFARS